MRRTFDEEIAFEKKKAVFGGLFLNFLFLYYLFFSLSYIWISRNEEYAALPPRWLLLALLPCSLALAFFWNASELSTGRIIMIQASKYLKSNSRVRSEKSWWLSFSGLLSTLLLIATLVLGYQITEMSLYSLLSEEGLLGAKRIFLAIVTPDWSILGFVLSKMVETIFIALMATVIAIPVAFVTSFASARNLTRQSFSGRLAYVFFRFLSNFTRSVEPIIWAIIFSVWVGIGPFAGMLALMLHSIAALNKLYSEQIESIDHGPIEAIEATGANKLQVICYAVLPQIFLPYLSFTIYRWDINVRMATIIGLVGGGGVGTLLMQYQGLAKWHEVGTIVVVIAVVVWIMDYVSARLREAVA